jgi:hypothetical protein
MIKKVGILLLASVLILNSFLLTSANTAKTSYLQKNDPIHISGTEKVFEKDRIFPPRRGLINSEFNPEKHWAFFVTVDYEDDKPWSCYKNIKNTLLDNHWTETHIKTVIQEQATKDNVEREFENWLVRKTSADDTVLIIFNAHGYENVEVFGEEIVPGGLCLYGYNKGKGALDENALQYDVLDSWLGKLSNRKIMIIIDACHSGNAIKHIKDDNRFIITSCEEDEYSYTMSSEIDEALTRSDSPFLGNNAPNLGDGNVSGKEVFEYLDHYSNDNNPQVWPSLGSKFDIDITYIKPTVKITRPKKHFLYLFDNEIIPIFSTIVVSDLTIQAEASDPNSGIKNVVFYIDDEEVFTDSEPPYSFFWSGGSKGNHKIKVVTHTKNNFFAYSYSSEDVITILHF